MAIAPYSGGSRTNIRLPHEEAPEAEQPEQQPEAAEEKPPPRARQRRPRAEPDPQPQGESQEPPGPGERAADRWATRWSASDGGGVVLAFFAWSWLISPLLTGGPARVKAVARAKWLNQGPNGEALR